MKVGYLGKAVKCCERWSVEAAIALLIPVVVCFLFLVVIAQWFLLRRGS